MKKIVLPLLSLLALSSFAQAQSANKQKSKVMRFDLAADDLPLLLKKQTTVCNTPSYDPSALDLPLHIYLQRARTIEARNFTGLLTGNLIQNENNLVISKTTAGEDREYLIATTSASLKIHSNGEAVTVCPEESLYAQDTIEGAALNAAYFINKTNAKVSALVPEANIKPVELKISPNIREKYVLLDSTGAVMASETYYRTDNAYYEPAANAITFLPHSTSIRKFGFSMSFWEVPMVASHEYGHHVFESLFFRNIPSTSIQTLASNKQRGATNCFGHHQKAKPKFDGHQKITAAARKVTISDVVGAYNEGFADLISHYTLSDQERGLAGVKCLEISRDVGSAVLFDGKPKIFSKEALASFFSTVEEVARGCEVTQYQDDHVIGAIFAHSADRILSLLTESKEQKLAATLSWAQAISKQAPILALFPPEGLNRTLFAMFVRNSAVKLNKPLDSAICSEAEIVYPGISASLVECKTLI